MLNSKQLKDLNRAGQMSDSLPPLREFVLSLSYSDPQMSPDGDDNTIPTITPCTPSAGPSMANLSDEADPTPSAPLNNDVLHNHTKCTYVVGKGLVWEDSCPCPA